MAVRIVPSDSYGDDDYTNALEFVTSLPESARACRGGRSHNFIDGEQVHGDENNGIAHTETRCARGCQVIKVEDYDVARGFYVLAPHYRYPKEGYLIKAKETGPIHPSDLAAASRVVRHYERKGQAVPKLTRRKKRTA